MGARDSPFPHPAEVQFNFPKQTTLNFVAEEGVSL